MPADRPATIAVSGASGFVGRALCQAAEAAGLSVRRLVRPGSTPNDAASKAPDSADSTIAWDPDAGTIDAAALGSVDVVVHLAGEGIADARWTAAQKQRIIGSRVRGTDLIARAIAGLDGPRPALLSGSAVGFYGDTGDRAVDETAPRGNDFLSDVVAAWEAAAQPAVDSGVRVAFLRTGVVVDPTGGMLRRQLPFFRAGLGGFVRPGSQYVPWISRRDEVRAILFLAASECSGPVNLVSPADTTNREFTSALGRALHRPTTILPITGPRLLFGRELADSLLLTSQRVLPGVLNAAGFEFLDTDVDSTLANMLG